MTITNLLAKQIEALPNDTAKRILCIINGACEYEPHYHEIIMRALTMAINGELS